MPSMTIPFDLVALDAMPHWQDGFAWPLPHHEVKPLVRDFSRRLQRGIQSLKDEHLKSVALLAPRVITESYLSVETALFVQAAKKMGLEFTGGPDEIYRIQGLQPPQQGGVHTPRAQLPQQPIKAPWLRRIARTATWTPWHSMVPTLVSPEATAVSHNGVLCAHAVQSGSRVDFRHAGLIFQDAMTNPGDIEAASDLSPIYEMLKAVVAETAALTSDMSTMVQQNIIDKARPLLEKADEELRMVSNYPGLPKNIWAGSGGSRFVRTLALAVRNRGGTVTLHDHSGSAGTVSELETIAFADLAVATHYVVSSEGIRKNVLASDVRDHFPKSARPEILAGSGDLSFKKFRLQRKASQWKRPKVLYVFGAFDGLNRRSPPSMPDPIKLDWWSRMAVMMSEMPIDFQIQPHPGGVLVGQTNPVEQYAESSGKKFEEAADWADVFVIDITQSTTVAKALCTDRPIVFIDYGRNEFSHTIQELVGKRARIVKASFNDRNLPFVDRKELEEAILSSPVSADPSDFLEYYGGV
jgi:hypothetical protein